MRTRSGMHLVEDDWHDFRHGLGAIEVRVRIWRGVRAHALVLVEGTGEAAIAPWAPRIATFVHHALFRGRSDAYCYVERSGAFDDETWDLVAFRWCRHHAVHPDRSPVTRAMVEDYVGSSV